MRTLTLWQPWASLVAAGIKSIETRSWGTSYRGRILIHAARKMDEDVFGWWAEAMDWVQAARADRLLSLMTPAQEAALQWPLDATLGRALCVAVLADCLPMETSPDPTEARWGTFGPGRWGWILADVRPLLTPIAIRGAQGLRDTPAEIANAVRAQVGD